MTLQLDIYLENTVIPIQVEKGQNLLQILGENNFSISSPCGGNKSCGKCKVKLIAGEVPLTDSERELLSSTEIEKGIRLACCLELYDNLAIELIEEGQIQIVTTGIRRPIEFDPIIQIDYFNNDQIGKDNNQSYLDLLYKKSSTDNIRLSNLQELANLTDSEGFYILSSQNEVLAVSQQSFNNVYGLAVDIGTTTVAVYLMDLITGKEVDVESFHNPQKKFGADVISRINYSQKNGSVQEVQDTLVKAMNQAIKKLSVRNDISRDNIYILTAVGNTTMLHFFLAVNPVSIGRTPYRPVFTDLQEVPAASINIDINPQGIVQVLPAVSGYVGSDIIANLLISDFASNKWNLLIDVGTNGEIVLGNKHIMLACSAAAGPAFEGANISFGVAGVPGAVSKFRITEEKEFTYQTIDAKKAIGICGSGLIDIIAEMLGYNIITSTGAFNQEIDQSFLSKISNYKDMKALKILNSDDSALDSPIYLTQKDVREVQLAKGAIAAGIKILLKEAGIKYEDIEKIYLAGGFGSFVNAENACKIGMLPKNMEEKIIKIGNGAGLGAKAFLLDKKQYDKIENIINRIEYIELSLRLDFQNEFMMSMEF
ncbi:MAG: ASKHA domain-containing protein [Halanaerobiales bacterium]